MKTRVGFLLAGWLLSLPSPSQAAVSYTQWYLAEGATTPFFSEEILVANPNDAAVTLTLTFLPENGTSTQHQVVIPATSRATIRASDYVSNDAVSVIVDATDDVLVERSMYWPAATRRGGHHSNGVTAPALHWYFAEGSASIFQDFVLVANPSSSQTANVTLTFLRDDGGAPVTLNRTVAPLKRDTVWINSFVPSLAGASFSTVVESTNNVPVLAERAMYWSDFEGGHNATGETTPGQVFHFAEGYTGGTFQTFLLLANPSGTAAHATVTLYPESGSSSAVNYTIQPNQRQTVWVNALPSNPQGSFSMVVESDVNITAERAMYWGNFVDGHSTGGSPVESTGWGFAEGIEDGHAGIEYDTFFLFVNSSDTDSTVEATFYREDGTGIVKTFTIPANKRHTLIPAAYPELTYQKFSAFFRSTNAVAFVAERAVYWGSDYFGGHASLGTPWSASIATPPAPPAVSASGISPSSGSTAGGTTVTISGDNFTRGTRVFFGGTEGTNVSLSSEQSLTVQTPAKSAGAVDVLVQTESTSATLTSAYTYTAPPPPPPPSDPSNIDLSKVTWLHTDVSGWAQTSTITGVSIGGGLICVYHTKAGQWPLSSLGNEDPIDVEGNVWIFAYLSGKWYAATYDWLRPGQECKNVTAEELGVDQIRIPPLDENWTPHSGDLVAFMVSTRARDHVRAGTERTNVHVMRWP
ncbi:MAG: IPT/TIG domain-containing protein [Vicinamibacterales bacterium]